MRTRGTAFKGCVSDLPCSTGPNNAPRMRASRSTVQRCAPLPTQSGRHPADNLREVTCLEQSFILFDREGVRLAEHFQAAWQGGDELSTSPAEYLRSIKWLTCLEAHMSFFDDPGTTSAGTLGTPAETYPGIGCSGQFASNACQADGIVGCVDVRFGCVWIGKHAGRRKGA